MEASSCCFWFSTKSKKGVAKNEKNNEVSNSGNVEWGKNDEILSDMSTFSVKEQEKRLKKALEEENKVTIEADRVLQLVKRESSTINASSIKSILSHSKDKRGAG